MLEYIKLYSSFMVTGVNQSEVFCQYGDLKEDPRVFKYDPRWMQINPERLPEQFNKVRKALYYDDRDLNTEFYIDWIVIGIYPDIFFLPIEIIPTEIIHGNGYRSTEYSYKVTNYDLFFKAKSAYNEKYPIKFLTKEGIIGENIDYTRFYPCEWKSDYWQVGNSCLDNHNPIYYGIILEESGFKYDEYFKCFKFEYHKIFGKDFLNCPIFATCLNFYDYLCNTKLSSIKVNKSLDWTWKNGKRTPNRTDFIELKIPFDFYEKINPADRVLDWITAANEPDEIKRTSKQFLESHGMRSDAFVGIPYNSSRKSRRKK